MAPLARKYACLSPLAQTYELFQLSLGYSEPTRLLLYKPFHGLSALLESRQADHPEYLTIAISCP